MEQNQNRHVCFQAFSEGAASTMVGSLKEKAPFTLRNALGIPLIVQHSANLKPMGSPLPGKLLELEVDQSLDLEHSALRTSSCGKLLSLQRQESCLFHLSIGKNLFRPGVRRLFFSGVRSYSPSPELRFGPNHGVEDGGPTNGTDVLTDVLRIQQVLTTERRF